MPRRFFINNLNTYTGQALLNELRNDTPDNEDPNVILGTYTDRDSSEKIPGTKKMLKRCKPRLSRKYMSECDLLIYDLHNANPEDIKKGLEALNITSPDEEKVFILITSLCAWNKTPPKMIPKEIPKMEEEKKEGEGNPENNPEGVAKEEGEEEETKKALEEEEENEEVKKQEEVQGEPEEPEYDEEGNLIVKEVKKEEEKKVEIVYYEVPYEEKDYALRVPSEDTKFIKEFEDLVLSYTKENVKTYVIASGILYGSGEDSLKDHLMYAWLQKPAELAYVGEGANIVPMIHVRDLARFVKRVFETKPEQRYLFATDRGLNSSQKEIISSISSGVGTGMVKSIVEEDWPYFNHEQNLPYNNEIHRISDWRAIMRLNLKLKPSSLLVKYDEEGKEEEQEFEWHCKEGIIANIRKIAQEYCDFNKLKPIKIFINGPPQSGKSFISKQVAEHYNIVHITISSILELAKKNPEIMEDLINEKPFDESELDAHPAICEACRLFLKQNACRYRGFILDGFPLTYTQQVNTFIVFPKKKKKPEKKSKISEEKKASDILPDSIGKNEEDLPQEEKKEEAPEPEQEPEPDPEPEPELEESEKPKPKLDKEVMPDSVIIINANKKYIESRIQKAPSSKAILLNRLANYNAAASIDSGIISEMGKSYINFFNERKIETFTVCLNELTNSTELFQGIRTYIERLGRPNNFLNSVDNLIKDRIEYLEEQMKKHKESNSKIVESKEIEEAKNLKNLELKAEARLKLLQEHANSMEKLKGMSMRDFLLHNVASCLTDGMLQVTRVMPVDPVDYLAEFLVKRSR